MGVDDGLSRRGHVRLHLVAEVDGVKDTDPARGGRKTHHHARPGHRDGLQVDFRQIFCSPVTLVNQYHDFIVKKGFWHANAFGREKTSLATALFGLGRRLEGREEVLHRGGDQSRLPALVGHRHQVGQHQSGVALLAQAVGYVLHDHRLARGGWTDDDGDALFYGDFFTARQASFV